LSLKIFFISLKLKVFVRCSIIMYTTQPIAMEPKVATLLCPTYLYIFEYATITVEIIIMAQIAGNIKTSCILIYTFVDFTTSIKSIKATIPYAKRVPYAAAFIFKLGIGTNM
jgi:hypothetical protein